IPGTSLPLPSGGGYGKLVAMADLPRGVWKAMGIYDREYYRHEGPRFLNTLLPDGRVCRWLLGVNIAVFAAQLVFTTVDAQWGVTSWPQRWLQLDPEAVLRGEVWRLLTYAFVHDPHQIFHILFNMLFLWWFGTDVEKLYGGKEFLGFYLVSALLGGLSYFLWSWLRDIDNPCIGASGAVTAVLVLCACHYPQRMILVLFVLPVPIWLFAVFSVTQDLVRVVRHDQLSPVASVVHLAGAVFGLLYYLREWRLLKCLPDLSRLARRRSRAPLRLYQPESEREAVPVAAAAANLGLDEHLEAKLDAVLEKVSRFGKDSLTKNERDILLRASEIYRRRRS
ncbi:MAG: rhomboid family intramembrane serine protease, partial [Gemmataceae bacterium]|nr:rhomboid family intramembrane serine protease [Gemmataceae bacterium]